MQGLHFMLDRYYTIHHFNYIFHISVIIVINRVNCVTSLDFNI